MIRKMLAKIAGCFPPYRVLLQIREALQGIRSDIGALRAMEALRHLESDLAGDPRYRDPRRLIHHAFQVNSQYGEDGIIHEIFRRIGTVDRIFTEIGVGDGTENNTAFLLSQGWKGFWIDTDATFLRTLNSRRDLENSGIVPSVSFVSRENVGGLFKQLGVPKNFDLLSLDVDVNTFYIWEALSDFLPRVVVVEYNSIIPPDIDWKVQYVANRTWDHTQNFGAGLKAYEKLGCKLGYSLVGCDFNGVNAFFVRSDLVADRFVEPFTAENHYEPPRYQHYHRQGHKRAILDRQDHC